jgi:hypothetical protein
MIDPKTGKPKKTVMTRFKLDEISSVDRPAQAPALAEVMKSEQGVAVPDLVEFEKALAKQPPEVVAAARQDREAIAKAVQAAVTTMTDGHAHVLVGVRGNPETGELSQLQSGMTSYVDGHCHSWVRDDAGTIIIADAEGHTHGISVRVEKEMPPEKLVAPDQGDESTGESAEQIGKSDGAPMSDQKQKAADPAVTPEQIETLTKRLETAEKFGALTDAEKAFHKSLDGDDADAFLDLDADARVAKMDAAKAEDPVVYTALNGDVFRKSDDPRLVKAYQEMDEEKKRRKEMEEKAKMEETKRKAAKFAHFPEDTALSLAKALSALPTEDAERVEKALTEVDAERSKAFAKAGTSADAGEDVDPIEAIAKSLIAKNADLTPEQAYVAAMNTPEGKAAYAKHVGLTS